MRVPAAIGMVLLATALSAFAQPATAPTTQQTLTGQYTANWPMPVASDYAKFVQPIARKFSLPVVGKNFGELRALTVSADGNIHPPAAGANINTSTDAEYSVYVPESYTSDAQPYGLFIWLSSGGRGKAMQGWFKALDDQKLIFIGPSDAGNGAYPVWRVFIALESVRQAKVHFNIDPDRIYVGGVSGGGRMSSIAATFYPDVFSGAFCMCGVNFWQNIPVANNLMWPGFWPAPDSRILTKARADERFVLLTGTRDMNLENTKGVFAAYQKDHFAHMTYLEVPGMGHQPADGEWFNKGIVALDQPIVDGAADRFNQAMLLEKTRKLGDAMLAFESVARHAAGKSFEADAKQHAADLRKKYTQQVAQIQSSIDQHQTREASAAIQKLRTDFGAAAAEQIETFLVQIRQPRQGS
jgi:predicted esterase